MKLTGRVHQMTNNLLQLFIICSSFMVPRTGCSRVFDGSAKDRPYRKDFRMSVFSGLTRQAHGDFQKNLEVFGVCFWGSPQKNTHWFGHVVCLNKIAEQYKHFLQYGQYTRLVRYQNDTGCSIHDHQASELSPDLDWATEQCKMFASRNQNSTRCLYWMST